MEFFIPKIPQLNIIPDNSRKIGEESREKSTGIDVVIDVN